MSVCEWEHAALAFLCVVTAVSTLASALIWRHVYRAMNAARMEFEHARLLYEQRQPGVDYTQPEHDRRTRGDRRNTGRRYARG